jgi:hypothetical protein
VADISNVADNLAYHYLHHLLMSGTQKKPTTTGFTAMTSPLGLNKVVNGIGTALHAALNSTNIKCQVFGLCEPRTLADGKRWPSMYNSTLAGDEFNLLPSDQWPSYIFFDRDDPITYEVPEDRRGSAKKWSIAKTKISLIFYGNLKWYGLSTRLGEDYRITKEELRNQILKTLWTGCYNIGGEINPTATYDLNITDIFKGYATNDVEGQYLAQPYYGLRVEMDVIYREPCGASIGTYYFSVEPTSLTFAYNVVAKIVTITSNTSYTIADNAAWITTVVSSGSGNYTLIVSCQNNIGAERYATLTFTPVGCPVVVVSITQTAAP